MCRRPLHIILPDSYVRKNEIFSVRKHTHRVYPTTYCIHLLFTVIFDVVFFAVGNVVVVLVQVVFVVDVGIAAGRVITGRSRMIASRFRQIQHGAVSFGRTCAGVQKVPLYCGVLYSRDVYGSTSGLVIRNAYRFAKSNPLLSDQSSALDLCRPLVRRWLCKNTRRRKYYITHSYNIIYTAAICRYNKKKKEP